MANKANIADKGIIILQLLADGLKQKEICDEIYMSSRGVDYHIERAKHILDASTRCELIAKSYIAGLIHFQGNFFDTQARS